MNDGIGTRRRRRTAAGLCAIVSVLAFAACDVSELLEVELPGNVTAEDVELPELASTVRVSAIGDFEWAWDSYVNFAARHSDEYMQSSGNFTGRRQLLRDIPPDLGAYQNNIFGRLHRARFMLEAHHERLQAFTDQEVPDRAMYMAEMLTYSGFVYVVFGEGFCGTPLDGDGVVRTPSQLLEMAVNRFTEAISAASAIGRNDLVTAALIGRARAYLDLEDYPNAILDAEAVTDIEFEFLATREQGEGRRENSMANTNQLEPNQQATVAPGYRDVRWKDVPDPRVNVTDSGFLGHDNSTAVWRHDKTLPQGGEGQDVIIASGREALLIIAEASAIDGDLDRARDILQLFHDRAGIPDVTTADIPTQDDVIRHVIEERRRELFVEGGHRQRDHLRWRGTPFEVPYLGEPGSDHPLGIDQYSQPYGDTTCFPVAQAEQLTS